MMNKVERKTNPVLQDLIAQCEEAARVNDAPVWDEVADALRSAARNQVEVNVSHIERVAEDGETVVVPGKVLGSGRLTADVTVAAFDFTQGALDRINESGETAYLEELVDENPDGEDVRLVT